MAGILRSTASNQIRLLVVMGCQFLLVPITLHALGTEAYGVYALALSVLGFLGLLELGAGTAATKYAALARGDGDIASRNRALSTLLAVSLASSVLAVVLVVALALLFPRMFPIPQELRRISVIAVLLLGARSAILAWPAGVFRSSLIGDNRIPTANNVQIITNIGLTITTWVFLRMGWGLLGVAASALIWFAVEAASYVVLCRWLISDFHLSLRSFDRTLLRSVASLSFSQLLMTVSGLILLRTDPIIVGSFLPIAAVGQYGVALKISENVFQLAKQYVNALSPTVARLHGAGDVAGLQALFIRASRHSTIVAGALIVGIVPWSDRLLVAWVGDAMLPAAPVMAILSLAMALCTWQMVVSNFLTYTNQHMKTVRFTTISTVVNIVASLWLVRRLGLAGVAMGTLVSVVLVDVLYATWLGCRTMQTAWAHYWWYGPGRPAITAIVVSTVVWTINPRLPHMNLLTAGVASSLTIACYTGVYFAALAGPEDREKLAWQITQIRRKLRGTAR